MRKGILATTVLLLAAVGLAQAQEGELHGSIDVAFQSKYIWRGFDIYDDKSAIQPSVDLDLYGTGFGLTAMMHRANSGEYEDGERWDYTLYYGNSLFSDARYATNYRFGWVYYNYPDCDKQDKDLQELQSVFSWPKLLGVKGLVPTYVLVKLWPSCSDSRIAAPKGDGTASGWAHIFMLDYALPIPGLLPETPEQTLNLHSEIIYNDGVGPNGANVDHDWSNAVFGISTDFDLGNNMAFTPGVYHQVTMDKSVNPDKDETWVSLNLKYKF